MSCINCDKKITKYRCKQCPEFTVKEILRLCIFRMHVNMVKLSELQQDIEVCKCSLICHKEHETVDCNPELTKTQTKNPTIEQISQPAVPFKTEDTVDPQKLKELENNERLKELLYNPYLREYLLQIDKSPNAWKAMKIAMLEPLFVEFANECLNIVEPDL